MRANELVGTGLSRLLREANLAAMGVVAVVGVVGLSPSATAQVSITDSNPVAVDLSTFTGAGFAPTPAAGQLDSDTWRITCTDPTCPPSFTMDFGDTRATGLFAPLPGLNAGDAAADGVYAFDVIGDGSVVAVGVNPGPGHMGQLWLRIQNDSAEVMTSLSLDFEWWTRNNGDSRTQAELWQSAGVSTQLAKAADDFLTAAAADVAPAWSNVDHGGDPGARSVTLEGLSVQPGERYYVHWHFGDGFGSGDGDETAIADIQLTAGFATDPTSVVDETINTLSFAGFDGRGFAPAPYSGQLDSDVWIVQGLSEGSLSFGGTRQGLDFNATSDFGRHGSTGGETTGGVYAFDVGAAEPALGGQPTDGDLTDGGWLLKISNDSTEVISEIALTYSWYIFNDQDKATALELWHSPEPDSGLISAGPTGNVVTPETADGVPAWVEHAMTPTLTGLNIKPGEDYYIHWRTDDGAGAGSRDEIAFGKVTYAATLVTCVDNDDCDDGLPCNGEETCNGGNTCDAGTPPDCDDGEPCTVDSCVDPGGCVNTAGGCDYGDAPDPTLPTLLASNGARHVAGGPTLGPTRDDEADGQPNGDATGDAADEDGVTITGTLGVGAASVGVTVNVQGGVGLLNAWVDFNDNGDFGDVGEQIFTEVPVSVGDNALTFAVPSGAAVGATFARFRLSSVGGDLPTGAALDGEVEDYEVTILGPDLAVTVTDGGATTTPGSVVTYTLSHVNNGDGEAGGVDLTATVPPNTTFDAAASSVGWSCTNGAPAGSVCTLTLGTVAAAGSGDTDFAVTVDDPVPATVSDVGVSVSIADDGAETELGDNSDTDSTPVSAAPDLTLSLVDDTDPAAAGAGIVYTLTFANDGDQGASGVELTVTVPPDTTYDAGSSSAGWVCGAGGGAGDTCTLAFGGLDGGGVGSTRDFGVLVNPSLASGIDSTNLDASVADDGANGADASPGDNAASEETDLTAAPDLAIALSDDGSEPDASDTITWTASYDNLGDQDADGVVLTLTVPADTTYDAGTTPGWTCVPDATAGSTCEFAVGSVSAGDSGSEDFATTVDPGVDDGVKIFSLQGSIADDLSNGADTDPGNNTHSDVLARFGYTCSGTTNGTCTSECGDSDVASDEECDDGDNDDNDGCKNDCTDAVCGDGVIHHGVEDCDDGPAGDDDGCSASCELEPGYTCDGADPTSCVEDCGTSWDFETDAFGWLELEANGLSFAQDGSGFTSSQGSGPAGAAAITRRLAVPLLADAVELELRIDYTLTGDSAGDCMEIYINTSGAITGVPIEVCTPGSAVLDLGMGSFEGTIQDVILRHVTDGGATSLVVSSLVLGSDADSDGTREYDSQSGCDRCIDEDTDDYGRSDSADTSTCPGGADIDCNDDVAEIVPNSIEICTGDVDDDCNGDTDLEDVDCQEDCANGVDDGGNGITDCDDAFCASDPICEPCKTDWTFDTGPATWTSGGESLWEHVDDGTWSTGGTGDVDGGVSGVYFGRLSETLTVPSAATGGPAPRLEITFEHDGDNGSNSDIFAVCVDDPSCRATSQDIVILASQPTGGEVTEVVDLTPYVDAGIDDSITVTLLYDTVNSNQNANKGLTVTRVKLASDVDEDGFEDGADAACDRCYDFDIDGYGRSDSPDLSTCTVPGEADCEDTIKAINPNGVETVDAGVCGDNLDNDCDGFTDGADGDCGDEDCGNGIDDNGDNDIDCDDAACSGEVFCTDPCATQFTFNTGGMGWTVTHGEANDVFVHGLDNNQSASGWSTAPNNNGSDDEVADIGAGRITGWLHRDIAVPADMFEPSARIEYVLDGDGDADKDVFAVCLQDQGTDVTTCTRDNADFETGDNTPTDHVQVENVAGVDVVEVPISADRKGTTFQLVLLYDTIDGSANDNPGLFVGNVILHSDADGDGIDDMYVASDPSACDRCIDRDEDGYGDGDIGFPYDELADCSAGSTEADCSDASELFNPAIDSTVECTTEGDNDCDGVEDEAEPDCNSCQDGSVGFGESCDDGNDVNGDGCSDTCRLEAGSVYVTEIHIPKPNGSNAEQFIEIYNPTAGSIDLEAAQLLISNKVLGEIRFGDGDCDYLKAKGSVIASNTFYVIAFGPENGTDGADPDAVCDVGFQLSTLNEELLLEAEDASAVELDEVLLGDFACETQFMETAGTGRSIVLIDPTDGATTAATNDNPDNWCLSGTGANYSVSGDHRGTPGSFGADECGEFLCDGFDDDCKGDGETGIGDQDFDGTCDAVDCLPNDADCDLDCSDSDGDTVPDCNDACFDGDGDGYGVAFEHDPSVEPQVGTECVPDKIDCDDGNQSVHEDFVEASGSGVTCEDAADNDCDGFIDCADDACFGSAACAQENCSNAQPLECGDVVVMSPAQDTFPCFAPDPEYVGVDSVVEFTTADEVGDVTVNLGLSNDGLNRYDVYVFDGACIDAVCGAPIAQIATGCASGGDDDLVLSPNTTYFAVIEQVGTCSEGNTGEASVSLACSELCSGGIDEDLDGATDCEDDECAEDDACLVGDFDQDGVSNADEVTCGTDPLDELSTPSADDVDNLDDDDLLNCVDDDDDGDGTSDAEEASQCLLTANAKNDKFTFPGNTLLTCEPNADQDCNLQFDTAEDICTNIETDCSDQINNDGDTDPVTGFDLTDCADPDCVSSADCKNFDFDNDTVSNGFEEICGTNPFDDQSFPAGNLADDVDGDQSPNCEDLDDDGDLFSDVEELVCGSSPIDADDIPLDTDGDAQCDAADPDDDNDSFNDIAEAACQSDPLDVNSTPVDLEHDIDQDGICNASDDDIDDDGWTNAMEETCGTDPESGLSNPTNDGLDGDDDDECDALDDDDDGDGWSDDEEEVCGTDPGDPESVPADEDGNGQCDIVDQDQDADGWSNAEEALCGTDPTSAASNPTALLQDNDNDHVCDVVDSDDDNDGWDDSLEIQCQTSPFDDSSIPLDTDGDQTCDFLDDDDDGDTWLDGTEILCGTDPLDEGDTPVDADGDGLCDDVDADADPDQDGWITATEIFCGTDPKDGDSFPGDVDGDELCDAKDGDIDGDTWTNDQENACGSDVADPESTPVDTDGDGTCDIADTDDDGDGVPDVDEELCGTLIDDPNSKPEDIDLADTDGDTVVNCNDTDDDGDGLSDVLEINELGSDPLNPDTDGDGLDDGVEDANGDGVTQSTETSPTKPDTDGDGLGDGFETVNCYKTSVIGECLPTEPHLADTDGDGLPDGVEDANQNGEWDDGETHPALANTDEDVDFAGAEANDGREVLCDTDPLDPSSSPEDKDGDGECDGGQVDTDSDGIADGVEVFCGTDPFSADSTPGLGDLVDSDADGDINCIDNDDDQDGYSDVDEGICGTDPLNDVSRPLDEDVQDHDGDGLINCGDDDDDNDGLTDAEEAALGTSPVDADSDEDGLPDGQEVTLGTSPTNSDHDGDGLLDGLEFGLTEPGDDTDPDLFEADQDPVTTTDPKKADTDNDGVCDGPNDVEDVCEAGEDLNADGAVDEGEGNPNDPTDGLADSDGDGLTDRDEILKHGTLPNNADSDSDGLDDAAEVLGYSLPNPDPEVGGELHYGPTDPLNPDSDGGGVADGLERLNATDPLDGSDDFAEAVLRGENIVNCGGASRGSAGGFLLLLFAALALVWSLRRRRRVLGTLLALVMAASLAVVPAPQAAAAPATGNMNIENFFPAGSRYRVWSVEQSLVTPAWMPYAHLLYYHADSPLVMSVDRKGEVNEKLVRQMEMLDFNVGIGLFDYMQLEIGLPIALYSRSQENPTAIREWQGSGVGDMVVRLRGKFLDNQLGGIGLGMSLGMTLPTGEGAQFRGDPSVGVLANLIFDWRTEYTVLAVNAGVRIRAEDAVFHNAEFSHELTYGLGFEVMLWRNGITLSTELFGRTPLVEPFVNERNSTLELMFGPKWWIISGLSVQAGAGLGLVRGSGTPSWRFLAGVQFGPGFDDSDGDGIEDDEDECPYRAEDKDGFADIDGCPDLDNDQDGIEDKYDDCPNQAEDFNNIRDEDGCPDAEAKGMTVDVDQDGLPDAVDRCPNEKETFNGFQDGDGCPDQAEDAGADSGSGGKSDGGDASGGDGGTTTTTPTKTEPDPKEDEDPACALKIEEIVRFNKGSSTLTSRSRALLQDVVDFVRANDAIGRVYINGHADEEGTEVFNLSLSKKRATIVKQYLIGLGLERNMLVARGFGEALPVIDDQTDAAYRANRRVDFSADLGSRCAR